MSCLYAPEPVSVPCLLEVVKEVRTGEVSTTTLRKALKQVDSGLALFGKPSDVGTLSADVQELATQLESAVSGDSAQSGLWLTILIAILKALM